MGRKLWGAKCGDAKYRVQSVGAQSMERKVWGRKVWGAKWVCQNITNILHVKM